MAPSFEVTPSGARVQIRFFIWKRPVAWLLDKKLGRDFWVFFAIAFFWDFGFSVYVFLFNLYLLDFHFNERAMGLVGGALTLGSVAGTLPVGWLARRTGLRPLLALSMIAAPLMGVARVLVMWEPAQIGMAFVAGLAMCVWGVCFLPALARVTTVENRASGMSLIFSVAVGTSALGGLICSYLPSWLNRIGFEMQPAELKRLVLLASCGIAFVGLLPLLSLKLPLQPNELPPRDGNPKRAWKISPFLLGFLPSMALWTAVLASFTPFANVYLSKDLHVPFARIGLIFSAAQVVQLFVTLLAPKVFRSLGLVNGIAAIQVVTAIALACLAGSHQQGLAVALFLSFSALQWMSAPGQYTLLMSAVPDQERSSAAAMTMFCNAVFQSCATAGAGMLFAQFGYPLVMLGISGIALTAAMLFRFLVAGPYRLQTDSGLSRCGNLEVQWSAEDVSSAK